jgi:transcriptional regulator with XRE-family HTH domain
MEHARVAREFLRAVRGRRSQQAFSRRLGYASNVAVKWEAGRRMPVASEALRACARAGIDVMRALEQFHPPTAVLLATHTDKSVAAWLSAQRGAQAVGSIAQRAGCSRYRVSRFLTGDSRPRVPEFFALIEALTGRLSELISMLVDIERVPSLAAAHRQVLASREAALVQPWSSAVLSLLASERYRASVRETANAIATTLGIAPAVATECLRLLRRAGVVAVRGGRFTVRSALVVDMRNSPDSARALRRHWAEVSSARLGAPQPDDLFSYNVFSVSRADYARMRQLQLDFFQQMRALAAASEPSELGGLMVLHLLPWAPDAPR